ncbi:hypothetical protein BDZ97DRAFT_1661819 [Flammula alnicola]|nr:hypothetical protein BDZ97DRAFT_1661819 [Flammula alnicola]
MALARYVPILLSLSKTFLFPGAESCRCLYGDSCWPNETAFSTLASQLSQPLVYPVPPASACYSSTTAGSCSDVTANFRNATWRADQPGALENINFETFMFPNGTIDACYLNVSLGFTCKQGSVPSIGVDARSVADVQAAVTFAKRHNLRLVIKNTGHDYLGRSAGRGGLMLWMHHLKDKSYDASFIPQGAPSGAKRTYNAVTLGAGVQWNEAYDFVQQQGRFVVGGISVGGSVGAAGGWVMGAGHSAFSPLFGLGVDNVLQFTIVLADGTFLTTNAYQHPDLFWALRGGGGGTYGVVISVTYQTHPIFPLTTLGLVANLTSPEIAQNVVTEFVKFHPNFSSAGWGGYGAISSSIQVLLVAPNVSLSDANEIFVPFVDFVNNATGGAVQTLALEIPSFADWYAAFISPSTTSQVGNRVEIASRLLPRTIALNDPAKAAKIMLSIEGGVVFNSVAGGAVSSVDPSSTGLNPSWRGALAEVYVTESWPDGASATTILQAIDRLKKNTDVLDQLTEDSGSFLNEGSLHERDFKKSFFGSHYSKLKDIKTKYDPTSLFVVVSGVGSDDWDKDLRCRVG